MKTPSPSQEALLPGLPAEFEELRPKLQAMVADPFRGSLATAFLNLLEACQQADRLAAIEEECCEYNDANLRWSEVHKTRGHLAAAGREILAAYRLALPPLVPLPAGPPEVSPGG